MTAKDEDTLTSKVLLKKGIAIDKMLNDIIINKTIKVDDLLVGDKNAVILAARISGYGAEYETKVACPSCEKNSSYEFDLNDKSIITPLTDEQLNEVGISLTDKGTFIVKTQMSKTDVELRLLSGKDEKAMLQKMEQKKIGNVLDSNITDQLKMLIVSVNGSTEQRTIHDYIMNMAAKDAKLLRSIVKHVTPNIKLEQSFTCNNCGFETVMEVPFTQDFFWPK
jgi:transcription elongation factor Elf1